MDQDGEALGADVQQTICHGKKTFQRWEVGLSRVSNGGQSGAWEASAPPRSGRWGGDVFPSGKQTRLRLALRGALRLPHPEGPSTQAGSGVSREGSPGPFKVSHFPHTDSKGCAGTGAFSFWFLSLHGILDYCHNIRS